MFGQAHGNDGSPKSPRSRAASLGRTALLGSVCAVALAPSSIADPTGGVVVAGDASISGQNSAATTVNQNSARAIINWDGFSVAADGSVTFVQPGAEAITLNRVVGQDPSTVLGAINANGRVVLVNPNGVLFGEGAKVDVASLVATTHDISNDAFMAGGPLVFDQSSGANGYVVNEGLISVDEAGLAAFVAPHVRNSGVIAAKLGTVELGAASMFTVDFYGDDLISFPIDAEVLGAPAGPDGQPVEALAVNDGRIEGGSILMTAQAARGVIDDVILAGGEMVATSFASQGGSIVLSGGNAGDVIVAGALDASGATGGSVTIAGERVLADGDVRANGAAGAGGRVSVAGDWVSVGGSLAADGAAGGVVTVAAGDLALAGTLSATGAAGAGGEISLDVEGQSLEFQTASLDVSGVSGGSIRNVAGEQISSSASYDASGSTGDGGEIDISAAAVKLLSTAVDASGANGGRVRIGGEFQGGAGLSADELANAALVGSSDGTRIDVSARAVGGAGGTAIVWSDVDTLFQGAIDARPGAGGRGGFIEVSSKGVLNFNADLQTGGGEVLLDPKNLTIVPDSFSQIALVLGYNYANTPAGLSSGPLALAAIDVFGSAVSLDGNRLAVGAPGDDSGGAQAGAVYLFSFSDGAFSNPVLEGVIGDGYTGGKNISVDLNAGDFFGGAVSLDGNRLAVGGELYGAFEAGGVLLFTFDDAVFTGGELAAILSRDPVGGDPSKNINVSMPSFNDFGMSVALDGNRLAVGASNDDGATPGFENSGAAYLFTFTDDAFADGVLEARIGAGYSGGKNLSVPGVTALDNFGYGIALDGDLLAVGARRDDGATDGLTDSGAVYLFSFSDLAFSGAALEGTIGSGYTGGKNVDVALAAGDNFGYALGLEGSTLLVGAPFGDGFGDGFVNTGDVHIFEFANAAFGGGAAAGMIGAGYTAPGDIDIAGLFSNVGFGASVSLDAGRLAIGAPGDGGAGGALPASGAVYLINRTAGGSTTPALATFANNPGADSFLSVGALLALLDAGNNVTLQANNDITVTANVLVDNAGGDGGALTLEAGRSILLNGSIATDNGALTLLANQTAAAGVVDAHRDAGDAVISMATGTSVDTGAGAFVARLLAGADKTNSATGDIALRSVGAGSIAVEHFGAGDVVLNGALSASGAGNSIVVRATGGAFTNLFGAGALNPGLGRFVVFSETPFANTLGGLTGTPYYNTPSDSVNFAGLPSGNVLAYELAPTLTITAGDATREYGEANPALTGYSVGGYINGDHLLGGALSGAPSLTTLANATSGVGGHAIAASLGSLVSNYNYDLAFADGVLTVTPALLTVAVGDATREYGLANPAFTYGITGFKNGETDSVLLTGPTLSTTATALSNVGSYAITGAGASAANYTFAYVDGALAITPALLTVTAGDASREYGDANPAFTYGIAGFRNGETESVLLTGPTLSTAADALTGVGGYAITGAGATAQNYAFAYVDGVLTIDPALLTVSIGDASREYGLTNPAFSYGVTGFKNGETESVLLSGPTLSTAATELSNVGSYAITGAGASAANYDFAYVDGTLTIDPALLTVAIDNQSRAYGAANPALTYAISGYRNGETDAVLTTAPTISTAADVTSNVGDYAITGAGASAQNYIFDYVDGVLTVGKALLTVVAGDASREYGDANPIFGFDITGFLNGDDASVVLTDPTLATAADELTGVGDYAITASGALADNYDFTYVDGTLTINRALLTVAIDDAAREYGVANPGFTYGITGFKNADTDAVLLAGPTLSTAATELSNVGSYAITGAGASAANYDFAYVDGALTIDPALLTVAIDDASREYGLANPAFSYGISGFRNGETESVLVTGPTLSTTATELSNVGVYAITGAGASAQNYSFAYVDGALTIDPALLTVAIGDATREYGDANPGFTYGITGFRNGETESVLLTGPTLSTAADALTGVGGYAITGAGATAQNYAFAYVDGVLTINRALLTVAIDDATREYGVANPGFTYGITGFKNAETDVVLLSGPTLSTTADILSNVGSYAITGSGASAANYDFAYVDGALTIDPALLTVSIDNANRSYGQANPTFTYDISGYRNGEDAGVLLTTPALTTTADETSNVGDYAITGSGATAQNYVFDYVDGVLSIGKALLTVVAGDATREYAEANPIFDFDVTGFVNGDDDSVITTGPALATTADQFSGVGGYTITASGALADNYDFAYVDGLLTITPALLTVAIDNATRRYGEANPAFTYDVTGFRNGEDASVLLSGPTLSTAANLLSNVGDYAITGAGADAANYSLAYVDGVLTVEKADLLVSANDAARLYGQANPLFGASYAGFVNGDDAGVLSGLTLTTTATQGSNVGLYDIVASGASAQNYNIVYGPNGVLTVDRALLTITANDASRLYGDANPVFGASYAGFVNGDDASVVSGLSFSTPATVFSNVGTYAIAASGGAAQNYAISYGPDGVLTIDRAPLTITANDAARIYGDANPAFVASFAGLRNGDASSVVGGLSFSTTATQSSNVGDYAITAGGGAAQNYMISYGAPGVLSVNPAALLITTNDAARIYGDANPTFTASFDGLKLGDAPGVVSGLVLSTAATQASNVGSYTITASDGSAQNYTISYQNTGRLTIDPAELILTVNDAQSIQGDPLPGFSARYAGLKLNDTGSVVTGVSFSTSATANSLPGDYVIRATGGTAQNYVIVQRNDGTLSIVQSAGQNGAVAQLQSDVGAGVPLPTLGETTGANAAEFVFATSTGSVGADAEGEGSSAELICVLADERECPVLADTAAE